MSRCQGVIALCSGSPCRNAIKYGNVPAMEGSYSGIDEQATSRHKEREYKEVVGRMHGETVMEKADRVAVISDIHGNTWALDAVLADVDCRKVDLIVNLGDSVYGSVDPAGTADRLTRPNIRSITGNQDRILWDVPYQTRSPDHDFVTDQMGQERLRWLASLPSTLALGDLFLCHGTPGRDDEYLLESVAEQGASLSETEDILVRLGDVTHPVILCGHSHVARLVWLPTGQLVVNPGSVGMPAYSDDLPHPHRMEAGSPHARYAILSRFRGGWSVEHVAVPYPWWESAAAARRRGREDRARWIETGRASI